MNLTEFADFIQSLANGDHGLTNEQIAVKLEGFGNQLYAAASVVRSGGNPWRAKGGIGERVRLQVVGPGGEIKEDRKVNYQ